MKKTIVTVILAGLTGAVFGAGGAGKVLFEKIDKIQLESDKHLSLFLMMNQWVKLSRVEKSCQHILKRMDIKKLLFME